MNCPDALLYVLNSAISASAGFLASWWWFVGKHRNGDRQ